MQELSSRQVLRHWLAAARMRRVRNEKGAALRDRTSAATLRTAWKEWRAWRCGCRVVRRVCVVSPFACWRQRAAERTVARARLLQATQVTLIRVFVSLASLWDDNHPGRVRALAEVCRIISRHPGYTLKSPTHFACSVHTRRVAGRAGHHVRQPQPSVPVLAPGR